MKVKLTNNEDFTVERGNVSVNVLDLSTKQDALISGTNIKTINNESILGSGNISIAASGVETDPVFSASAAAGITSSDITNWNGKTSNTGTVTGVKMNGTTNNPTSGVVDLGTVITSETSLSKGSTSGAGNAVTDISVSGHQVTLTKGTTFLTEHQSLASLADGIYYDSTNKRIYLRNGSSNLSGTYAYIDATDFIKDGMVDSVTVGTPSSGTNQGVTCLIITFNTFNGSATHQTIELPISQIFNASNYYTKTDIDNAGYLTSETSLSKGSTTGTGNAVTDISVSGHQITLTKGSTFLTEHQSIKTVNNTSLVGTGNVSVGTVTGVKMNGTTNNPTSGVVDLGTVITSETSLSKGTATGGGNAVTDISVSGHQITLTKGKTFLESETDPVFSASAAAGITSSDITNWNGKTSNTGTVTGVKMNGTTNNPTSGVVDLGTVITSETSLSKGTTTGSGNAVTDISVNGHQITLTKGTTFLTSHQTLKTINSNSIVGSGDLTINELPTVTSADNGKILMVVNGAWALVSPSTIYTGTGTPSSGTGNNGDIYLQTN